MATEEEEVEIEAPDRARIDQVDLMKSYLSFGWRAVRQRKLLAGLTFAAVFGISLAALAVWPRSYHCQSILMIQGSGALISGDGKEFRGVSDIVRRRENLLKIVKDTDLVRRTRENRTGIQRFKDRTLGNDDISNEAMEGALVWSLQGALWVQQAGETLTFGIDWNHPESAAKLVEAAQKIYLESRHVAEISTIQEKMEIMDGHALKVRKEIDAIAEQIKGVRDEKVAEKVAAVSKVSEAAAPAASATAPAPRPRAPRPAPINLEPAVSSAVTEAEVAAGKEELATLREELNQKRAQLKDLKGQRTQEIALAQAKMSELLTKYTPAHPEVRQLQRTIDTLGQDSPRAAPVEAEIAALTTRIKEKEQAVQDGARPVSRPRGGGGGTATAAAAQPKSEALPAEILGLLDSGAETDPAVTAQLQGAISKYAGLRDAIRTARIELDTAQAAFTHRYKVIEPAEPPLKPSKPNVQSAVMGGFFGALLLALLLPLVLELRRGKIVDRWQVYQMKLPILAELRLPSGLRD